MRSPTNASRTPLSRRRFLQVSGAIGFSVMADPIHGYAVAQTPGVPANLTQSPVLEGQNLPPVAERVGSEPAVLAPIDAVGTYGGTWRTALIGGGDAPWLDRCVGYDNLVRWSPDWSEVLPNLAKSFEASADGKSVKFVLRDGVKWSDGQPFTSADIEFYVNDYVLNTELNATPPENPHTIEVHDPLSFTITWERPEGFALMRMCQGGDPWVRYPRHYLEQFHKAYNPDGIDALVAEAGVVDWIELFRQKGAAIPGTQYDARWSNPELPRLNAWVLREAYGAGTRVRFERNPYYWKVDTSGQQLPYIDEVVFDQVEDQQVLLLKASSGEIDFHSRHITTDVNKPVLAENREKGGYEFFDIVPASMNTTAIALNLSHKDPTKREIFGNLDFRIGLSHAINRQEIIDAVYVSQGEPWQLAPRRETPWFNETLATQYTEFNVDLANEHLDKVLPDKNGDGLRLGPDGNPFTFVVEVAAEISPTWTDTIDLVVQYWGAVGISASLKPEDRSLFYTRKDANELDCGVWAGDGGLNDAMTEARWYYPHSTESIYGLGWVVWAGNAGGNPQAEPVEPPEAVQVQIELYKTIRQTVDPAARDELFKEFLVLAQQNFHALGVSLPAMGYGIKKVNFKNVPPVMPGAALYPNPGPVYTETFFFEGGQQL